MAALWRPGPHFYPVCKAQTDDRYRPYPLTLRRFLPFRVFYLINTNNLVHGNKRTVNPFKLGPKFFFRRVHNDCAFLAKDKILNNNESIQIGLINFLCIDFINLP